MFILLFQPLFPFVSALSVVNLSPPRYCFVFFQCGNNFYRANVLNCCLCRNIQVISLGMELQIHTGVTSTSFHVESQKNNFGFTVAYHNEKLLNHLNVLETLFLLFLV